MVWAKLGSDTLSGTADQVALDISTTEKFIQYFYHLIESTEIFQHIELNSDTGTNYARRYSSNGGTDVTQTSQSDMQWTQYFRDQFEIGYITSIDTEEKLIIAFNVGANTAGAANVPTRMEIAAKHDQTTNPVNRIEFNNNGSGDYATGSNLSALTGDETETVTLQDGTIFEETDTNKAYIWNASTTTWTQL